MHSRVSVVFSQISKLSSHDFTMLPQSKPLFRLGIGNLPYVLATAFGSLFEVDSHPKILISLRIICAAGNISR